MIACALKHSQYKGGSYSKVGKIYSLSLAESKTLQKALVKYASEKEDLGQALLNFPATADTYRRYLSWKKAARRGERTLEERLAALKRTT